MDRIWIIGGTTEGRLLAEFCEKEQIPAVVSVVSGYGEQLLPEGHYIQCETRSMDETEMELFLLEEKIGLVVDAAHPFAPDVHRNIREACSRMGREYLRCVREKETPEDARVIFVRSIEEAVSFLAGTEGNILVTTGSHSLGLFRRIPGWKERVYARILPSSGVLRSCEEMGFAGKNLIAMQGPFSREMNGAILREVQASWMVTKESGKTGGYPEKAAAAADMGAGLIVIRRPEETGLSLEDVKAQLKKRGLRGCSSVRKSGGGEAAFGEGDWNITLAGIGPGSPEEMTPEVRQAVLSADVLIGAERMLEAAEMVIFGNRMPEKTAKPAEHEKTVPLEIREYRPEPILRFLLEQGRGKQVVLLYSGDTEFYSGAGRMAEVLMENRIPCRILRGESSASYFLKKLGIAPEASAFASVHEGAADMRTMLEAAENMEYLTVLTGRTVGVREFLGELVRAGLGDCPVHVGERLSYPEEKISCGTARELAEGTYDTLSVVCAALHGRGGQESVS